MTPGEALHQEYLGRRESVALKPGAGFIDKVQPADVVKKVNGPIEIFHDDSGVMN